MRTTNLLSSIAFAGLIGLAACYAQEGERPQRADQPAERAQSPFEDVDRAVAVLHGTQGNEDVHGTVHFIQQGSQVRIIADVYGLEPGSVHAIHAHEYGDCTAPDATSAGGHYNPEDHPHELPPQQPRHAGDFGNLDEANAQGRARLELTVDNITIADSMNPVLGRAVIVHAQRDTGEGESGEAGDRIACGVIGVANPETRPGEGGPRRVRDPQMRE